MFEITVDVTVVLTRTFLCYTQITCVFLSDSLKTCKIALVYNIRVCGCPISYHGRKIFISSFH
jgi:hypothetical protein